MVDQASLELRSLVKQRECWEPACSGNGASAEGRRGDRSPSRPRRSIPPTLGSCSPPAT